MIDGIKAIIFDLDGTLINSMSTWEKINLDLINDNKLNNYNVIRNHIDGKTLYEIAEYFINNYQINKSIDEVIDYYTHKIKCECKNNNLLRPGVVELLNSLHGKCYIALATSNSREIAKIILTEYNINNYFDCIKSLDDVKKSKPDPEIYLQVAKSLNISTKECVVVEDSKNGVKAALEAGMNVCVVNFDKNIVYDKLFSNNVFFISDFLELSMLLNIK